MLKTIALVVKQDDPHSLQTGQALLREAQSHSLDVCLGLPTREVDVVICVGGDGSLLATIRKLGSLRHKTLILGIHGSRGLGFLHPLRQPPIDADPQPWAKSVFRMLVQEQYIGQSRWGLEAEVVGKQTQKLWALNDIVLNKGSISRMIDLRVSLGDEVIIPKVRGDGLIVSSATGSTAYSLSAGGPVLDPVLRALLITPVCSHTVGLRPMVLNADREMVLERMDDNTTGMVTADGQEGLEFAKGSTVRIRMSDLPVRFLIPQSDECQAPAYSDVLRNKLGFGRDH